jgi:hypothetical protein
VFHGQITACDCEECTEIREALQGKRWDEIPAAFVDLTCSPALLTTEAGGAFLPAYLFRGLDDLERRTVVLS